MLLIDPVLKTYEIAGQFYISLLVIGDSFKIAPLMKWGSEDPPQPQAE